MAWDDDEDWVGEPPEGRHSGDRAKPEFWRGRWQEAAALAAVGIVAIVALIIILAGCGGDDEEPPKTAAPFSQTISNPRTGTAALEPGAVGVADFLFDPASAEVEKGDTVTWVNTGAQEHTVKGTGFESKPIKTGGTFEHRFKEAGRFAYVCTLHPRMKGTVVVG